MEGLGWWVGLGFGLGGLGLGLVDFVNGFDWTGVVWTGT